MMLPLSNKLTCFSLYVINQFNYLRMKQTQHIIHVQCMGLLFSMSLAQSVPLTLEHWLFACRNRRYGLHIITISSLLSHQLYIRATANRLPE